ncbi:hypothetical protein [Bradyrhizobium liaoningense]|uniref:hypothetical protein n=1 Tax=Bradyrhizobium liaoningense TaxID=43992 RepID=UPI001FEAF648|nr:hypothetical protein [Bradyrhizobium liaoningense]
MMDFYSPRDLNDELVEESIQIGLVTRKSPDVAQNANVTPKLVRYVTFLRCCGRFFHWL